jgi:hypothetical protein
MADMTASRAATTTEREFLDELAEIARAARAAIEASQIGLDPSPAARAERRRRVLLHGDFEFFCYTYLAHHIRPPASNFHRHFFARFPQILDKPTGAKEWWIAPRGEAKSSLLTKVGPVWCAVRALLQRPAICTEIGWQAPRPYFIDYVTLLGAETKLPTKLLEVVKTELQFNAGLALDFPEACGASKQWKIGEFTARSGVKFEAFGAEQAIRGTFHGASRPKLLLGDDLITDKEAKSPTERENRWDWLEKAVDFLGPPDGTVKFVGVGTILNKDDPISRAKAAIGHLVHHFRAIERLPEPWISGSAASRSCSMTTSRPRPRPPSRAKYSKNTSCPRTASTLANRAAMDAGAEISWPQVRSLYVADAPARQERPRLRHRDAGRAAQRRRQGVHPHPLSRSAGAPSGSSSAPATHPWAAASTPTPRRCWPAPGTASTSACMSSRRASSAACPASWRPI